MITNTMWKLLRRTAILIGQSTLWSLTLLGIVIISLTHGLADSIRALDETALLGAALISLICGWWLARTLISNKVAVLISVLLGLCLGLLWYTDLRFDLIQALSALVNLRLNPEDLPADWQVLQESISFLITQFIQLAGRLFTWATNLITGNHGYDAPIIKLVWGWIVIGIAVWAGWVSRRWRRPLAAISPAGILLAGVINYTSTSPYPLLPLVGSTLLLMAHTHFSTRRYEWQDQLIDYSEEASLDVYLISSLLAISLSAFALVAPSPSVRTIVRLAQRVSPFHREGTEMAADSLGLKRGFPAGRGLLAGRAAGLPRQHLLGSGTELTQQVVMLVQISDPESLQESGIEPVNTPRFYWRGVNYDMYTGDGWRTGKTEISHYQSGQWVIGPQTIRTITTQSPLRYLKQSVRGLVDLGDIVYAAGNVVQADKPLVVLWRDPPGITGFERSERIDQFGALLESNSYEVISLITEVSAAEIRTAPGFEEQEYPEWFTSRYFSIPESIPQRVLDLSAELVSGIVTSYDKAKAIEAYLRQYPYTLELEAPPAGKDVVDYFLFEERQGYCDYFASAMVVLARAARLPARLASGFASGTFDPGSKRFVVTAADAHSWPEIYFPDIGWVEFEPTSGQPELLRPENPVPSLGEEFDDILAEDLNAFDQGLVDMDAGQVLAWLGGIAGTIALGFGLWATSDALRLRSLSPSATVGRLYTRTRRMGSRLGLRAQPGETPNEYRVRFSEHTHYSRYARRWWKWLINIPKELLNLVELYNRSVYSQHPPKEVERDQAIKDWGRLGKRLWFSYALSLFRRKNE